MKQLLMGMAAILGLVGAANAHLTAVGWKDNGNGSITLWGQHWHGDQSSVSTANGGIHVGAIGTPSNTWAAFQWTGLQNNVGGTTAGMNAMVAAGTLTGYHKDPANFNESAGSSWNDWFYTSPLVLGNGTWGFITGPNCCIDTMSSPGQFTVTGVTSVGGGTGPGNFVPEPGSLALLGLGLFGLGASRLRKQAK